MRHDVVMECEKLERLFPRRKVAFIVYSLSIVAPGWYARDDGLGKGMPNLRTPAKINS
jgi:hypothetical protein